MLLITVLFMRFRFVVEKENWLYAVLKMELGLGLRAVKRLVAQKGVFVNGLLVCKNICLRHGSIVEYQKQEEQGPQVRLLGQFGQYVAFSKPRGLHTVHLHGGRAASLEDQIPKLFEKPVCLLTRLDFATSGIVLGCLSKEVAAQFRMVEQEGGVCKKYLALVCGELKARFWQHNALRTNGGKQSRVLAEDASRLRWTEFVPLVVLNEKPSWLKASIPCPVTL